MADYGFIARGVQPIDIASPLLQVEQIRQARAQEQRQNELLALRRQEMDASMAAVERERVAAEELKARTVAERKAKGGLALAQTLMQYPYESLMQNGQPPPELQQVFNEYGVDLSSPEAFRSSTRRIELQSRAFLGEGPKTANDGDYYTLAPGSVRFGPDGKVVASVPPTPPAQTVITLPSGQAVFNPRTGQMEMIATREDMRAAEAADVAATESAKIATKGQEEAKIDLPLIEQKSKDILSVLNNLENSGLGWVYGSASYLPTVKGTKQADAVAYYEQLKGVLFLQAFETLKGGGQITQIEGDKATQAISTLSTRDISPKAAAQAIEDLKEIVRNNLARARQKAAGQPSNLESRQPVAPSNSAGSGAINFGDYAESFQKGNQ